MKILIAYDGSECARAALDDLRSAGLPSQAKVRILTVQESWMPPPSSYEILADATREMEMLAFAQEAAVILRSAFPQWEVKPQVEVGTPGSVLLHLADDWQPDLLVVGSHGRSALGRFFLGSVSQKAVTEAHGNVRIARGRIQEPGTPLRLLLGIDGSPGAAAAVNLVAQRHWPENTELKLINAAWVLPPMASEPATAALLAWSTNEQAQISAAVASARQKLQAAGLQVTTLVKEQDPKHLLCDEAEKWGADCIFVGAKGVSRLERLLLGSVSAAVAARAHCSVEVVRPPL